MIYGRLIYQFCLFVCFSTPIIVCLPCIKSVPNLACRCTLGVTVLRESRATDLWLALFSCSLMSMSGTARFTWDSGKKKWEQSASGLFSYKKFVLLSSTKPWSNDLKTKHNTTQHKTKKQTNKIYWSSTIYLVHHQNHDIPWLVSLQFPLHATKSKQSYRNYQDIK